MSQKLLTPFRLGFLAGLGLFGAAMGVAHAVNLSSEPSDFNIEITGVGADLDLHGASRIVLSRSHGVLFQQTCNGGCDDLLLRKQVLESAYEVRVLTANGACVACDGGAPYVTGGNYADVTRWTLKGRDAISAKSR